MWEREEKMGYAIKERKWRKGDYIVMEAENVVVRS